MIQPARLDGRWTVVGKSLTGATHRSQGVQKQDALAIAQTTEPDGSDLLVIAASDGAGSAFRSGDGSRTAVATVTDSIDQWRNNGRKTNGASALNAAAQAARAAVSGLAQDQRRSIDQYACTLLIALVVKGIVSTWQIGDGAIIIRNHDKEFCITAPPQKGRYDNETMFITSPDAKPSVQTLDAATVTGIAVFTDGLEPLLLDRRLQPYRPALEPIFDWADAIVDHSRAERELEQYLQRPDVAKRSPDDMTICLAVQR